MLFFTHKWQPLGSKADLKALLAEVTGILEPVFSVSDMEEFSIAQRMSWASKRETTRPEDIAYCLMGIFNVNMPLLYGEGGEKAFIRLQEEILKSSDDQSLFVWGPVDEGEIRFPEEVGLLAKSPAYFARFANVVPFQRSSGSGPSSVTNKGLQLSILLIPSLSSPHKALLDCHFKDDMRGQIGISLHRNGAQYSRLLSDPFLVPLTLIPTAVEATIFVKRAERKAFKGAVAKYDGELIVLPEYSREENFKLVDVFPRRRWDNTRGLIRPDTGLGCLVFSYGSSDPLRSFTVRLDFINNKNVFFITKIVIREDEGKPLGSLYGHQRVLVATNTAQEMVAETVFGAGSMRMRVTIKVRKCHMLNKAIQFVDVSAGPAEGI